jgi:xylulokinase
MAIGGLDIGTTGCKITIYDEDGKFRFQSYREYQASRILGRHELAPDDVWGAVCGLLAEAAQAVPDIRAIGVTSFGESFVLLDEQDRPLLPAPLYTDPRGASECQALIDRLGAETIAALTGVNPHPMYSLPKLMWLKNHRAATYRRARRVMLFQDYLAYLLTGRAQIDYSLATRTMAFDIRELRWNERLLEAAGIDRSLLSQLVPSGTAAGVVKESLAAALHLRRDTLIVSCCHDQVAAAVGAGVFEPGMAIDGTGTVECITPVLESIPCSAGIRQGSYAIVPHAVAGKYVCYAFTFTGGVLLKWYRDQFARYETMLAKERGQNVYAFLDGRIGEGPTGILVLPHFAGAATPYMDPGSKGAIVGLTLEHSAADLYKALMEGVTYEMLLNIERLRQAGIDIRMLRATGGGAGSKVWLQMKADILNLPIVALDTGEAGAVGSVMLSGVAAGIFPDLESAARLLVLEKAVYHPDPRQHQAYQALYARYRELYAAVRPLV